VCSSLPRCRSAARRARRSRRARLGRKVKAAKGARSRVVRVQRHSQRGSKALLTRVACHHLAMFVLGRDLCTVKERERVFYCTVILILAREQGGEREVVAVWGRTPSRSDTYSHHLILSEFSHPTSQRTKSLIFIWECCRASRFGTENLIWIFDLSYLGERCVFAKLAKDTSFLSSASAGLREIWALPDARTFSIRGLHFSENNHYEVTS